MKTYAEYACYATGNRAEQVQLHTDMRPECWWPACSVTDGAYVPSVYRGEKRFLSTSDGGACPSAYTECLNLISDIDSLPANLRLNVVNSSTCKGTVANSIKTTITCGGAMGTSSFQIIPAPSPGGFVPSTKENVADIDKYFANKKTSSTVKFAKPPQPNEPVFNKYMYIIVFVGGLLVLLPCIIAIWKSLSSSKW
jgi:hypothetical protein